MLHLGEAVLNPGVFADSGEDVLKRAGVFLALGELDAVGAAQAVGRRTTENQNSSMASTTFLKLSMFSGLVM